MGFITADVQPHKEFECELLYEDVIDPIVAVNHPLARKRSVTLEELAEHTLIMSPARRRTRRIIEDAFRSAGVSPHNVIDVYIHTAAARLAESGLGVALLPRAFINQDIPRHRFYHLRIVGDPIRRTLCMVRRKDVPLPETVRCFYELMLQYKDSLGNTRVGFRG
jgi:DNA-binding transcriptional LysR family regulator